MRNTFVRSLFHWNHHPPHHYHCNVRYGQDHVTKSVTTTITSAVVVFSVVATLYCDPTVYSVSVYSFPQQLSSIQYISFYKNRNNNQYQPRTLLHRLLVRGIPTTLCAQAASSNYNDNEKLLTTSTTSTTTKAAATTTTTTLQIPEPKHRHIILPPPSPTTTRDGQKRSGILVIGDVHGCYDEMILLYNKAIIQNNNQEFYYVILVGDICNKGPQSMQVIRHMQQPQYSDHWICIRGNHENAVLRAYQEIKASSSSSSFTNKEADDTNHNSRYRWLLGEEMTVHNCMDDENNTDDDDDDDDDDDSKDCTSSVDSPTPKLHFTDEDYEWMSNLPYTIRIPANHIGLVMDDNNHTPHHLNDDDDDDDDDRSSISDKSTQDSKNDIVIVHAGLVPGIPIEENDIPTMVVLRDLSIPDDDDDDDTEDESVAKTTVTTGTTRRMKSVPWASVWDGPEWILFGHDAKRGLQLRYDRKTIGLDTGCVYGNQLTGMILPSRTLVQVNSLKQHVPIVEK